MYFLYERCWADHFPPLHRWQLQQVVPTLRELAGPLSHGLQVPNPSGRIASGARPGVVLVSAPSTIRLYLSGIIQASSFS